MAADHLIKCPRKLIEVALPLDAINEACAHEKQPFTRKHPRSFHIWWARRPNAAARAVIFAQMVNDPAEVMPGDRRTTAWKEAVALERQRLFAIITDLVQWENTTNEVVLERARAEIQRSWREVCLINRSHPQATELFNPDRLPAFHDPFAGGGALPLEAQRLGLEAHASDLNPVAVTINKAMIEIPSKFTNRVPVGPLWSGPEDGKTTADNDGDSQENGFQQTTIGINGTSSSPDVQGVGAGGLAEDVRRYGVWIREEARKRIGKLYPSIVVTAEMAKHRADLKSYVGESLTVISWLWVRTVKSPNPAFREVEVPLASTFILSSKQGKEAYVEPVIKASTYTFRVRMGLPSIEAENGTKLARGGNFRCVLSGTPMDPKYLKSEGMAQRMGTRLMAIVAEGRRGRVYLDPIEAHESLANGIKAHWKPTSELPNDARAFTPIIYGLKSYGDLFTPRQLVALTTFSDLVGEAIERCCSAARIAGMPDDLTTLEKGGAGALAYAQAVGTFLGMATSRWADLSNSICSWNTTNQNIRALFSRQAIPMTWDFAELNPMGPVGPWFSSVESIVNAFGSLCFKSHGKASQENATRQSISVNKIISTDPPYYDNIGYADLSEFFYVWLRRTLRQVFPDLYAAIAVPKAEELVATPYRHGGRDEAEAFFLNGMMQALRNLAMQAHPSFPVTIYYAFKQSETSDEEGTTNTGWVTFLQAVIDAGFTLSGTWPMRTERDARSRGIDSNALASSIVLVCRRRAADAPSVGRREFLRELNAVLPEALADMTRGYRQDGTGRHAKLARRPGVRRNQRQPFESGAATKKSDSTTASADSRTVSPVAPVDLSQAIIGPGMGIFSKYCAVLEADGKPMQVRTALQLINRFLAEDDFDHDTQFCLAWFQQHGWDDGKFGEADVLARSKGTSVDGCKQAGVVDASGGIVRLLKPTEYPSDWDPQTDRRLPVWEALHQMIRIYRSKGEAAAGRTLISVINKAEAIRQLAYRLYTLCERTGQAEDARAYNDLVAGWGPIEAAANANVDDNAPKQTTLFDPN